MVQFQQALKQQAEDGAEAEDTPVRQAPPEAASLPPAASEQALAAADPAPEQPAEQAVRVPTPVRMRLHPGAAGAYKQVTGRKLAAADLLRPADSQGQQQGASSPEQQAAPASEELHPWAPRPVPGPSTGQGPRLLQSQAAQRPAAADLLASANSRSQQQDSGSTSSAKQPAADTFEIAVEPTYLDVPVAFEE